MSTVPENIPVQSAYPATLSVDYPDRKLDKFSSFFRIFYTIPIWIVLALLGGGFYFGSRSNGWSTELTMGGITFFPLVLMILFRKKYPKWWFDWNLALTRFNYRVIAYLALLRDEYPSTDEEQALHLDLTYPDVEKELGRGWPLIKWLLAIPHAVILLFLLIAAFFCVIGAWFVILFPGRYPKGIFDFVVGVGRWGLRVEAYAVLLITDKYPPFSLD